ncbi:MAG: TolC family protein [Candidatus Eisenbacteria bacterium]|nr:TolC family protein [Candidatus Eisenbacteria bacterium]
MIRMVPSFGLPSFQRSKPGGAMRTGPAPALLLVGLLGGAVLADGSPARAEQAPDLSRPVSLEEAIRLAKERNHGLAQSRDGIDGSRGALTSAKATYFPSLRGNLGADHSEDDSNSRRVVGTAIQEEDGTSTSDGYSVSIGGGAGLFDPASWLGARAAQRRVTASEQSYEVAEDDLVYQVTSQYFTVVRGKQLLEVAEQAYTLAGEQLERAQALYELGSVAKTDVLQAQVSRAASERDRIAARNSVEQQRAFLAVLLALPVDSPIELEEAGAYDTENLPSDEPGLIGEALERRPDLFRTKADLEATGYELRAAQWSRFPTVDLSYSYRYGKSSFSSEGTSKLFVGGAEQGRDEYSFENEPSSTSWSVGVGMNIPIFDGFLTKGSIQRAEATRRAQQRGLEQAKLDAALEVRTSLIALKNAEEEIRSAREGVGFAEESVRLQKALYESGGGTLLQWNNAQVELTRARVSLVEAGVNLQLARAGLDRAIGRSE